MNKNDKLFSQGDPVNYLYIIINGEIEISKTIYFLPPQKFLEENPNYIYKKKAEEIFIAKLIDVIINRIEIT